MLGLKKCLKSLLTTTTAERIEEQAFEIFSFMHLHSFLKG